MASQILIQTKGGYKDNTSHLNFTKGDSENENLPLPNSM